MHDLSELNPGKFSLKLNVSNYVTFAYPLDHVVAKGLDVSALSIFTASGKVLSIQTDMYGCS